MDSFTTIKGFAEDEFVERRSRFICAAMPVGSPEQAGQFIAQRREQHRTARHTVWAYRLKNEEMRFSDDGEPQGTGGAPVLETIKREGIADICIAITRYFGGILLGAPGLTRAYSFGALKAIEASDKIELHLCQRLTAQMDYADYNRVLKIIEDYRAVTLDSKFSEAITLSLAVRSKKTSEFAKALADATSDRVRLTLKGSLYSRLA